MLKIGLIGTGVMGSMIARAIDQGRCVGQVVAVTDLDEGRARRLSVSLRDRPLVLAPGDLIRASDLVVEAAAPAAIPEILREVIRHRKDLIVLSVGGLIDQEDLLDQAVHEGSRIHCPSGAVAGLDAVRAAGVGIIEGARITTTKPPRGLAGAPWFREKGIEPGSLNEPSTVFEGSAREACRLFPQNVNVSAALSLAGIGPDRTEVRIVADPGVERNIHRIEVWGDFGRIETLTENVPSENPRTSRLAALSAIALIQRLSGSFQVGT